MQIKTKFGIGQTVHFMKDGVPSTDKVDKVKTVTTKDGTVYKEGDFMSICRHVGRTTILLHV